MVSFDKVDAFLRSVQQEAVSDAIMTHTEALVTIKPVQWVSQFSHFAIIKLVQ